MHNIIDSAYVFNLELRIWRLWGLAMVLEWKWEGSSTVLLISPLELLPILFALVVWGKDWRGEERCDNVRSS